MAIVSPTYFDVLGVPARHGRTFRSGDAPVEPGGGPVVISHRVASLVFGSEDAAVNQNITINARRRIVLGVMPASFQSPVDAEIWETVDLTGRDVCGAWHRGEISQDDWSPPDGEVF